MTQEFITLHIMEASGVFGELCKGDRIMWVLYFVSSLEWKIPRGKIDIEMIVVV